MPLMKILLIEDNKELAQIVKRQLAPLHINVDIAYSGEEGIRLAKTAYYEVIVTDLLLDIALSGLDVIRLIRKFDRHVPIIVESALQDLETKISAFSACVDDYIVKPFHIDELAVRIRRHAQRANRPFVTQLAYRGLVYDVDKKCVCYQDRKIFLKNKEAALFEYMINHTERPLSRDELITSVWHLNQDPNSNIVDVAVKKLRQKIDKPLGIRYIKTLHGIGYRFGL